MSDATRERTQFLVTGLAEAQTSALSILFSDSEERILFRPEKLALEKQLAQVLVIIDQMAKNGELSLEAIAQHRLAEKKRLNTAFNHNKITGSTQIRLLFNLGEHE